MIFVSNILMISQHVAFNTPFDLMYDICYPLHAIFVFAQAVVNPAIFDLPRFLTF